MNRTIQPKELKELLEKDEETVILDVRRRTDYESDDNMIPGAVWRDPEEKEMWIENIPRDKEVVIYCVKGGSVSNSVLDFLLSKDIKARYVEGGIKAWKEAE